MSATLFQLRWSILSGRLWSWRQTQLRSSVWRGIGTLGFESGPRSALRARATPENKLFNAVLQALTRIEFSR